MSNDATKFTNSRRRYRVGNSGVVAQNGTKGTMINPIPDAKIKIVGKRKRKPKPLLPTWKDVQKCPKP